MISLYDAKPSTDSQPKISLYPDSTPSPKVAPPAPIRLYRPSTTIGPEISPKTAPNAFKGSLGNGYGASSEKDPYSEKPLLTFENTDAKASQLLSDRVAPTFDPTIPQKVDPKVLHNGRMPQTASEAVRKATGAEPDEQLDHLISLEVGGSNETSNLNNEKLLPNKTQPSLPYENQIAKLVANGDKTGVSYVQGQKMLARLKGVQLPDDSEFPNSPHPLLQFYPKPSASQQPSAAKPAPASLGPVSLPIASPANAGSTTAQGPAENPRRMCALDSLMHLPSYRNSSWCS